MPFENDPDAHVAKEVRDAIRRIEKDDRISTHAEEAAKNAASRKAAAEALDLPGRISLKEPPKTDRMDATELKKFRSAMA